MLVRIVSFVVGACSLAFVACGGDVGPGVEGPGSGSSGSSASGAGSGGSECVGCSGTIGSGVGSGFVGSGTSTSGASGGFGGSGFGGTGFAGSGFAGTGVGASGFAGTGFAGSGFAGTGASTTGFANSGAGAGFASGSSSSGVSSGSACPSPDQVVDGKLCAVADIICDSVEMGGSCSGAPSQSLQCACLNGSWTCAHSSTSCPQPGCPGADQVVPNASCDLPQGTSCSSITLVRMCDGTMTKGPVVPCTCENGGWSCPPAPMMACVDASAPAPCPDPAYVLAGNKCPSSGQECSGNPQSCAGTTYYDALECSVQGLWTTVASTVCDIDGGAE